VVYRLESASCYIGSDFGILSADRRVGWRVGETVDGYRGEVAESGTRAVTFSRVGEQSSHAGLTSSVYSSAFVQILLYNYQDPFP
jgi:hypothetical protein